jgi:hypothetical protein
MLVSIVGVVANGSNRSFEFANTNLLANGLILGESVINAAKMQKLP